MRYYRSTPDEIRAAASALREGAVLAFPTETVYGLAANATDETAVRRIFSIKGRPADHPLILHIASPWELEKWVESVSPVTWALAGRFWPGPLTLVMKRSAAVPDVVTGGQDTVAIRIPDHPSALALLHAFGGALAAPSANLYGKTSPTSAAHVIAQLGGRVDGMIDGGACHVGIESTILDLSSETPRILRQGSITAEMLAPTLGGLPEVALRSERRVPGSDRQHYAPSAPLYLVDSGGLESAIRDCHMPAHVLVLRSRLVAEDGWVLHPMSDHPDLYARELYETLHAADACRAAAIVVEMPPARPEWAAVTDRLSRAAGVVFMADHSKSR